MLARETHAGRKVDRLEHPLPEVHAQRKRSGVKADHAVGLAQDGRLDGGVALGRREHLLERPARLDGHGADGVGDAHAADGEGDVGDEHGNAGDGEDHGDGDRDGRDGGVSAARELLEVAEAEERIDEGSDERAQGDLRGSRAHVVAQHSGRELLAGELQGDQADRKDDPQERQHGGRQGGQDGAGAARRSRSREPCRT